MKSLKKMMCKMEKVLKKNNEQHSQVISSRSVTVYEHFNINN